MQSLKPKLFSQQDLTGTSSHFVCSILFSAFLDLLAFWIQSCPKSDENSLAIYLLVTAVTQHPQGLKGLKGDTALFPLPYHGFEIRSSQVSVGYSVPDAVPKRELHGKHSPMAAQRRQQ